MLTVYNPDRHEAYQVRNVPLDEAAELSKNGTIFYDNTKLVAINTCPTFGVMRYAKHRTDTMIAGRNLALECGSACHDFFAALRMWTLLQSKSVSLFEQVMIHGTRLFGEARWEAMGCMPQDGDPLDNATRFALDALHSSGFYNDPSDRRRTMENMEVACITYADRYFKSNLPILVRDDFIGIEVPFVIEIKITNDSVGPYVQPNWHTYYYCGRIDGVHEYGDSITLAENKTTGRIDDHWRRMFHMSSQITGYMVALSAMLDTNIDRGIVMGLQIPAPARDIYSGVSFETVTRTESDKLRWFEWFLDSVHTYETYADPVHAPRYTHSCNRYFSTCQFLPFCTATREEQRELIEGMRIEEWSPLDHVKSPVIEGE